MRLTKNINDTINATKFAAMRTQEAAVQTITTTQFATIALVGVCIVSVVALAIAVKALNATN